MATPTTHLGLLKPGYQDPYDIATMNDNWDLIDAAALKMKTTGTFDADEVTMTNSHIVMNAGWSRSGTSSVIRIQGQMAYIRLAVLKNAIISIADSNDIGQEDIGTLQAAYLPKQHSPMKSMASGRMAWGYLDTDGSVVISSISGGNAGTDLPASSILDFSAIYMLASA